MFSPIFTVTSSDNGFPNTFSLILITTLPLVTQATPDRADFTEVSNGGGYTTGGIA